MFYLKLNRLYLFLNDVKAVECSSELVLHDVSVQTCRPDWATTPASVMIKN